MKAVGVCALVATIAGGAPDARNIGGNGTGRGKAQTYQMAGGKSDKISLRLNLYDKDVGEMGWEFHGDVALSVVDAVDKQWYEMGCASAPSAKQILQQDSTAFKSSFTTATATYKSPTRMATLRTS